MKKVITIILALCFITPVFAGTVGDIDGQAWMQHTNEMQGLRKGILSLVTKENRTDRDDKMLGQLVKKFDEKHMAWENYLRDVAENGKDAVPPTFKRSYKTRAYTIKDYRKAKEVKCTRAQKRMRNRCKKKSDKCSGCSVCSDCSNCSDCSDCSDCSKDSKCEKKQKRVRKNKCKNDC